MNHKFTLKIGFIRVLKPISIVMNMCKKVNAWLKRNAHVAQWINTICVVITVIVLILGLLTFLNNYSIAVYDATSVKDGGGFVTEEHLNNTTEIIGINP